ncbi:magnesium and cobalt transport protein CorA [Brevundimonas diminuta]|uniref:magnesium and cobalt transport protein CorA n=1 Tax=Brevundimonas TaxID=41275 RepID=UPI0002A341AF|nr:MULTISPECIES: magnesium and cobalt transport protein CorA [Brevundimonas]EKY26403.1 magnesium and cobalt transport protein CorA [Brevundimonas diminuta 470-4]HAC01387.1 magnesium and cobalt transport protein CorA [Brevundimonas sp.]MCO8020123.1 magnesium and cobalt transport protein CorA [Brevundimonas diminuta]MCO8022928.1 magnesium and cobalt transport protein CorA [Brevundimonas diminuta]HAL06206.1 magnesium and cobalt transport protein CorA [Brevundimonas sp.]
MSVVASYVYKDGKRVREAPLTDQGLALAEGEYLWIGLHEPSDDEFDVLVRRFHLHPLAVEDALTAHQIPKLEVYGSELFIVARTAQAKGDRILYGETHVFVGPNYVITIRHGSARAHTQLRAQLEASPHQLKHGPDFILHGVLDFIVDGYIPIIDAIEDKVLEMEQVALDSFLARADITRLFHLRRELLKFSRVLGPMEEVCVKLQSLDLPCIDREVRPYFRDVADHVRRVSSRAAGLRDILASVFEVSNLLEQQRQGVITRKLAAWAAILATPTAVAGIYGMNFEHMPELRWTYGYPAVLALIVAICIGLYVTFKRSKWL